MNRLHNFLALWGLTLCTIFSMGNAFAQSTLGDKSEFGLAVAKSSVINLGQKLIFNSAILQQQIELNVYLPESFHQSKHYQTQGKRISG